MSDIKIRPAIAADKEWVIDLMNRALEPYYGGNHKEHAERILRAHLNSGIDDMGYFSFEQRMFIAVLGETKVGMIHIVGKKQGTYKISPLIVEKEYQRRYSIGTNLYQHAVKYIRDERKDKKIRQVYCTVAGKNRAAISFFKKMGFIEAGKSLSQYKEGITEVMLYNILDRDILKETISKKIVSVVELEDIEKKVPNVRKEIKKMLLEELPKSFDGIDEIWVDSLFSGYDRRDLKDVNAKYKLIYVALDDKNKVVGVAGATPKKGTPIKIMPLIAPDRVTFNAMIMDLPYQLSKHGHRIYTHLTPEPDQVITLQKNGWTLDGLLPEAYSTRTVTQQWGLKVSDELSRTIRVKDEFMKYIMMGEKDLEVRVGYNTISEIKNGDIIKFRTYDETQKAKIIGISKYNTFEEMLEHKDYRRIMPWAENKQEVCDLLRSFYSSMKEALGVYVFEFKIIQGN